ncbi:unannotated protein [freshwater metagenome]|uniref:Unannotated protein n=1 Tax=freshwater metagenome TaxID=449393 RepID=A0A6J7JCZ7_9ZZZZ
MTLGLIGTTAADDDGCALFTALGDVALDALTLTLGDERSAEVLGVGGIAGGLGANGGGERITDLVVAAGRGEHAGESHTGLTVVHETATDDVGDGLIEVRVLADDGGRLATELQGAALELLATDGADLATGSGGAGEAHLVDVGMTHEILAHLTVGGNDVDDTGGDAGLDEHLGEEVRVERGLRGRLDDDRGTRSERGAHLEGGDEQRHVPGNDAGADADRLATHDDLTTEGAVTTLLKREVQGVLGEGVQHHRG